MTKRLFYSGLILLGLNFSVKADKEVSADKEANRVTEQFQDVQNLENYVSKSENATSETVLNSDNANLVSKSNIDIIGSKSHINPHHDSNGWSFRDHPVRYIIIGLVLVLFIVLIILVPGAVSVNAG